MSNIFQFTLVSKKATYNALETKDANTMYAIVDTSEIYFDGNRVAAGNVRVVSELPKTSEANYVYVVTSGEGKGIYISTGESFTPIVTYGDFITATSTDTLTNKTISASSNTISGLSTTNFDANAVSTTVNDVATALDTKLVTELAVSKKVKDINDALDNKVDKVEGSSLMTSDEHTKLEGIETGANKYVHSTLAEGVQTGTSYNKVSFDSEGHVATASAETTLAGIGITDAYTSAEIDTKLAQIIESLDWKESVATFADIATTYPTPEDGWTVSTKDTDQVYRYDSATTSWVNIFQSATNIVEPSTEGAGGHAGLMTAAMAEKLNGVEAGGEVNQNAFASITTDDGTITSDSKTDSVAIVGGTNVSVSATTVEGTKTITITGPASYVHPSLASGVTEDTAYNKVTFDAQGHVKTASAETTLVGLGVSGSASDITSLTGYEKATESSAIATSDTLNSALGKLEYRVDSMDGDYVAKDEVATTVDSANATKVPTVQAVIDTMTVRRI